jgi:two-component system, LytTR family, sensor kinase
VVDAIGFLTERYGYLLSVLLVQIAVVAMFASVLLRFRPFVDLMLTSNPTRRQRLEFGVALGVMATLGAWGRLQLGYTGLDMTVVMPLLAGYVMGPLSGAVAGIVAGVFPLWHAEWLALPVSLFIGWCGGLTRVAFIEKRSIWLFSPIPFGNVREVWITWRNERRIDPRLQLVLATTAAEILRTEMSRFTGGKLLFGYNPLDPVSYYAVLLASLTSVPIALKIWNTPRLEAELDRQQEMLSEARLETLRQQIQPHFLFNTLNTISVLTRTHPEDARRIIVRLSAILRRLLYTSSNTSTLRDEIELVRNYVDIETMRFGEDRLRLETNIEQDTLRAMVPTMTLQPLVENAIKHGLAEMVEGGLIMIRSWRNGHRIEIEVADNGRGMSGSHRSIPDGHGIGLRNLEQRCSSLYGTSFSLEFEPSPGEGTTVRLTLPLELAP